MAEKKTQIAADNQIWYFRQGPLKLPGDDSFSWLPRIVWDTKLNQIMIAAAPNGIFATSKPKVADYLRSMKYPEVTAKTLRKMDEFIPEPDQVNYDRDKNPKYIRFGPQYDMV